MLETRSVTNKKVADQNVADLANGIRIIVINHLPVQEKENFIKNALDYLSSKEYSSDNVNPILRYLWPITLKLNLMIYYASSRGNLQGYVEKLGEEIKSLFENILGLSSLKENQKTKWCKIIANVFLSTGKTHEAICFYEKALFFISKMYPYKHNNLKFLEYKNRLKELYLKFYSFWGDLLFFLDQSFFKNHIKFYYPFLHDTAEENDFGELCRLIHLTLCSMKMDAWKEDLTELTESLYKSLLEFNLNPYEKARWNYFFGKVFGSKDNYSVAVFYYEVAIDSLIKCGSANIPKTIFQRWYKELLKLSIVASEKEPLSLKKKEYNEKIIQFLERAEEQDISNLGINLNITLKKYLEKLIDYYSKEENFNIYKLLMYKIKLFGEEWNNYNDEDVFFVFPPEKINKEEINKKELFLSEELREISGLNARNYLFLGSQLTPYIKMLKQCLTEFLAEKNKGNEKKDNSHKIKKIVSKIISLLKELMEKNISVDASNVFLREKANWKKEIESNQFSEKAEEENEIKEKEVGIKIGIEIEEREGEVNKFNLSEIDFFRKKL